MHKTLALTIGALASLMLIGCQKETEDPAYTYSYVGHKTYDSAELGPQCSAQQAHDLAAIDRAVEAHGDVVQKHNKNPGHDEKLTQQVIELFDDLKAKTVAYLSAYGPAPCSTQQHGQNYVYTPKKLAESIADIEQQAIGTNKVCSAEIKEMRVVFAAEIDRLAQDYDLHHAPNVLAQIRDRMKSFTEEHRAENHCVLLEETKGPRFINLDQLDERVKAIDKFLNEPATERSPIQRRLVLRALGSELA